MILECLGAIISCAFPLIQRMVIDLATSGNTRSMLAAVSVLGITFVFRTACQNIVTWLRGALNIHARQIMKGCIFSHLIQLPEGIIQSRGAAYFFNRMQNDIGETVRFLLIGGLTTLPNILKLLIAGCTIGTISMQCLLLLLPFLGIQILLCHKFRKTQYSISGKIQECVATERQTMQDILGRHTMVRTHAAEEDAGEKINLGLERWKGLARNRLRNESLIRLLLNLPVWICCGIVVFVGLVKVSKAEATLGEVWALNGLLMLAFAPIRTIAAIIIDAEAARSSWNRLRELLNMQTEETTAAECPKLKGDVVFSDVSFYYNEDTKVLDGINFTVQNESCLFITGPNGTGKSTILSLLLRLYSPQSGKITIGGQDIKSFPLAGFRSRIGYIDQRPNFIKGTIRENLLLGNSRKPNDAEILDMFSKINSLELIESRPGQLDAPISENGDNFSGGQKLRLALVRELLRDTDILLFDEAAANLDMEGRAVFYKLLQSMTVNKTILAVVHDIPEIAGAQVLTL